MVTDNIKDNNMEPVQYVYALSNPSFPDDYIKIGCTTNNPVDRAKSMQSTGVPTPFDIMFVIYIRCIFNGKHYSQTFR